MCFHSWHSFQFCKVDKCVRIYDSFSEDPFLPIIGQILDASTEPFCAGVRMSSERTSILLVWRFCTCWNGRKRQHKQNGYARENTLLDLTVTLKSSHPHPPTPRIKKKQIWKTNWAQLQCPSNFNRPIRNNINCWSTMLAKTNITENALNRIFSISVRYAYCR